MQSLSRMMKKIIWKGKKEMVEYRMLFSRKAGHALSLYAIHNGVDGSAALAMLVFEGLKKGGCLDAQESFSNVNDMCRVCRVLRCV